ncbi:MAG TPA: LLM class flavin-dependent oxidoreductase [Mycobacteriales bacterium]|nr:LLM class flavin-dependent oxidoreductase [Mycobacteriales bacterium]
MFVIGKSLGFDAVGDARRAEEAGYDGVRAIDHFFSGIPPARPEAVPHCFVTLAAAAAVTNRVLITQTMVAPTLRHPFEVAQAVACLDRISDGRAELGIGTAWLPSEHDQMNLTLGPPRDRVARALEAATICREMFHNSGCVDFAGRFFTAKSEAAWPATPHVPEIQMGAHGPAMIRAAASIADRVDLVESLVGGRPDFTPKHVNSAANLADRIAMAREVAAQRDVTLRFSATVNVVAAESAAARDDQRTALATASDCEPAALDDELLRIVDVADGVMQRLETLSGLGVDRLHIRPMDDHTRDWLGEALPAIQAIG